MLRAYQAPLFKGLQPNPDDIVYTPDFVVFDIIDFFKPNGKCLDPCCGSGEFLNQLPVGSGWCEIRKGKDFFNYTDRVDWIVGNPPYSIFVDFLRHSFRIAENVVYLVPTNKIFQSFKIMDQIDDYGGIKSILVYGAGQNIGMPFGFSVGVFHFKKGYCGETKIKFRRQLGVKAIGA